MAVLMAYAGCFLFKEKVQSPMTRIWKAGICEKVRSDFGSALLTKYYQFWKVSADMSKEWLGLISINVSKATPSKFFGKVHRKPVGLLGKCTFMKSPIVPLSTRMTPLSASDIKILDQPPVQIYFTEALKLLPSPNPDLLLVLSLEPFLGPNKTLLFQKKKNPPAKIKSIMYSEG